jgi:hypothetical protein
MAAKLAWIANTEKAVHSGLPYLAIVAMTIKMMAKITRKALKPLASVLTSVCACIFYSTNSQVLADNISAKKGSSSRTATGSSKASLPALRFEQEQRFYGKIRLTVAAEGLRMDNLGQHYSVISKPPLWNATVFRNDDKTIYEQDFAKFMDTGMISNMFISYHDENINGPAVRIKINDLSAFQIKSKTGMVYVYYLPTTEKFSRKEMQFVHALLRVPTNGGIPLHYEKIAHGNEAISGRSVEGDQLIYLNTAAVKSVAVDASIFDIPKGYKRVKFVGEVTVGKESRTETKDFSQFLDQ